MTRRAVIAVALLSALLFAIVVAGGAFAAAVPAVPAGPGGSRGPLDVVHATAADPIEMVTPSTAACSAPCVRQGVRFATVTNRFTHKTVPLELDLYRSSRTPASGAPVVLLLHGGGFVDGDRTQMRGVAERLAQSGLLVASADYRLIPASRAPTGAASTKDLAADSADAERDAELALRFLRSRHVAFGAAPSSTKYAIGGYSAGAITALRVGLRGGDASTPAARRFRVGGAFSISGTACVVATVGQANVCKAGYDRRDPPILLFQGNDDTTVPPKFPQDTCASAILQGGGCRAYFYKEQGHFWTRSVLFGGAPTQSKAQPAIVPTIIRWLKARLH